MSKEKLDRIENKLDLLTEKQSEMNVTLAVNTEQLAAHIEGVRQTRHLIAMKEKETADLISIKEKELEARLVPIVEHVNMVHAIAKIASFVIVSVGVIEGVVALLEYLRK